MLEASPGAVCKAGGESAEKPGRPHLPAGETEASGGLFQPRLLLITQESLPRAEGLRAGQAEALVLLVPSKTESEPKTSSQRSHGPSLRLIFRPAWSHAVHTREKCWERAPTCPGEPAGREAPREPMHGPVWGLPPRTQGLTSPVPQCGREGQARAGWNRDSGGQGQQGQRGPARETPRGRWPYRTAGWGPSRQADIRHHPATGVAALRLQNGLGTASLGQTASQEKAKEK